MRAPDWLIARPIAHRGLHDLAAGIVENMPAAMHAAIAGRYAIETDVQLTADCEAMVHHDDRLGRLNDGDASLLDMTSTQLKQVTFKATAERMITLGELCDLVDGRVPLVIELKSHFDNDTRLVTRVADVLATYRGPVAVMSFDPAMLTTLRAIAPKLVRGIVAERHYTNAYWSKLSDAQRRDMTNLRHALRTQPHFVSYNINDLPSAAPWIARHLFGCALICWTVRTQAQRDASLVHSQQMTFEGFRP
jgi:glycerophosphoryl diester phosphodiesterase